MGLTARQGETSSYLRVARPTPVPGPAPGREAELQAVMRFLEDAAAEQRVLGIVGGPGIGKTHLWRVALQAASSDAHRLWSPSFPDETAMDYVVLADLLSRLPEQALANLAGPQRRALETALLRRSRSPLEPHDRHIVGLAVRELMSSLARNAGIIIAIDDAHTVDAGTASALTFAMRRLEGHTVRVLITAPDERDVEQLVAGWRVPSLRIVSLQSLPVDAFTALVGAHRAEMLFPRRVSRLHRAVGGNPSTALAILDRLDGYAASAGRLDRFPVPPELEDVLRAALVDLPSDVLETLQVAAAMSRPTLDALTAVVGPQHAAVRVGRAVGDGVVQLHDQRLQFVDPLMPSFLYYQLSVRDRLQLHRRLAAVQADPAERSLHEALAIRGPAAAVAATVAKAALGERARGEPDAAAELAIEAVRLTPDHEPELLYERTHVAVRSLVASGDIAHAASLLEHTASRHLPAPVRAELLLLLARLRSHTDHAAAAVHLLRLAMSDDMAPEQGARIAAELASVFVHMGYLAEAEHELDLVRGSAGDATVANVRLWVDFARGRLDESAMPPPPATVDPLLSATAQPLYTHGTIDIAAGRIELARNRLESLQRQLALTGDDMALGHVLSRLSEVERVSGNAPAALQYADAACTVARRTGQRVVLPFALGRRAIALARLGRLTESRTAAHEGVAIANATGARRAEWINRWALGFAALSEGDHEQAAELLVPVSQASYGAGFVEPSMLRWIPDAVEALVTIGDRDLAAELLEPFELASSRLGRGWGVAVAKRCRALLLSHSRDRSAALAVAHSSVELYRSVTDPFELARTMLVAGLLHRRQRLEAEAGRLLQGSLALFDELGATTWATRLRQDLTVVTPGPDRPLTSVEFRVAELASTGLTNRQIAAQLFISPKTVETHLSSVYRKLGIRSRASLAHHLDTSDGSPLST